MQKFSQQMDEENILDDEDIYKIYKFEKHVTWNTLL